MLLILAAALAAEPASVPPLPPTPPVVIRSEPLSGAELVDPGTTELRVTFDRPMRDGSWSFTTVDGVPTPELPGAPRFLADRRTCVVPARLKPGVRYAVGVNLGRFTNFADAEHRTALPWVLTFTTGTAADPHRPLRDLSTAVADDLARGRLAEVAARFDDGMRAAVSAAELERAWQASRGAGAPLRQDAARIETADGLTLAVVGVHWAERSAEVRVVADATGRISGLWVRPVAR